MVSSPKQLADVVNRAMEALHANEKFSLPVLAVRAEKAAQANPHDASLVTASNVLKKMASTQTFISRQELNGIYDKLYSPNTKLAEVFAAELDRKALETPHVFQRSGFEEKSLSLDYEKLGDPVLRNALSSVFDGHGEAKIYSDEAAKKAEKSCVQELFTIGMSPKAVSIFAGENDILVCDATYETPKGQSHVLIPIELKEGNALLPTMFLSQAGFADLTENNLKSHIEDTAGKSFKVDGESLLNVLAQAKNGSAKEVLSDVDLAVTKLHAESELPAYADNGVLYTQIDNPEPDLRAPDVELEPEHISFAQRLASPKGIADHIFGEKVVEAGRNLLSRKLREFGFKHAQVAVSTVQDDKIVYSVAVDRTAGFKVPVTVTDGLAQMPTVIFASGQIGEFSAKGISEVSKEGEIDKRSIAEASPMYALKPSELMAQVRAGIAEGNLAKAEDAIDVLGETDLETQKKAIALLLESFNPETLKKVASEQKGCSMIVQGSHSKHPLCGHLNRPVHEVYQDAHGDCQPLYRKGMEETNDGGGTFMTHRILGY